MSLKSRWQIFWGILGCYLLYLVASFSSWHEPIMGDEVTYALFVRGLIHPDVLKFFQADQAGFGLWHPPLYAHVLSFFEKFSVLNAFSARLVGLLCFLISLILINGIARKLYPDDPKKNAIGLFACLLFSLNPLAVRGSLLIDMDGTMLNAAVLGFVVLLLVYQKNRPGFKGYFLCAAGLALCFWVKLATPIFLVGSFVLYFCLTRDFLRAWRMIKIIAAGLVVFSVSWFFYTWARQFSFWSVWDVPWTVVRGFFAKTGVSKDSLSVARNVWAVLIWCGPSFILLGLISLGRALKGPAENSAENRLISLKPFAFYGFIIFCVYFIIGGVTHSFPKYHYALLPVFVVAISGFVIKRVNFDRRLVGQMVLVTLGLAVLVGVGAGDPLYTINYALKEDMVLNRGAGSRHFLFKELVQMACLFGTIPIAYFIFKLLKQPRAWLLGLVASAVACHLALSGVQMKAPYNTVYCYGAQKVDEAAGFVRSHTNPVDRICAPPEIVWLANNNLASYLAAGTLRNRAAFLDMLKNGGLACLVGGISGNTVEQYKTIFNDPEIRAALMSGYQETVIGSYQIWLKK